MAKETNLLNNNLPGDTVLLRFTFHSDKHDKVGAPYGRRVNELDIQACDSLSFTENISKRQVTAEIYPNLVGGKARVTGICHQEGK